MFMPTRPVSASPCENAEHKRGTGPAIPVWLQTDRANSNTDFTILTQSLRSPSIRQSSDGSVFRVEPLLRFL